MSNEKNELKRLRQEINSLRNELNKINVDKENWFKKKEELKKEIHDLIDKVKEVKKESDVSSSEVEKLKSERDSYNAQVRELIGKIRSLNEEKDALLKKYGLREDPSRIKENIEKLNEKIETEALSFDKEKKLMEQIKRLKKVYEQVGSVKEVSERINSISKEIEIAKGKANEAHEKLKKIMREHKGGYREFFSISKQINMIKKQQERAFEMFIGFKRKFVEMSGLLKDKLIRAKEVSRKVEDSKERKKEIIEKKKEKRIERIIEEKVKKVEEKMKKGEKLTTEDILAMQGKKE